MLLYLRGANFAFVCFSSAGFKSNKYDANSAIYTWANDVKKQVIDCLLYLVATKADLLSEDDKEEFQEFLDQKKAMYSNGLLRNHLKLI